MCNPRTCHPGPSSKLLRCWPASATAGPAGCDVLYYDPSQVGQPRRDPAGHPLGPASDGWQPCTAPGQAWTDPELVLRWICTRHRRQLVALCAAGLANQVRWQRPGLSTHPAQAREATP